MSSFIDLQHQIIALPKCYDLSKDLKSSKSQKYQTRIPSRVKQIVLHHSAHISWNVYDVARHHVVNRNWPGIGYHIIIADDGNIFLTNQLSNQSYHIQGNNFKSIGICCLGNFEETEMTELQERALMMVLWTFGLYFHELEIYGHCDLANTLCPGKNFPLQESKDHYFEAIKYRSMEM
jgi:N-acetylmuramoyl-L-alanine amidase